MIGANLPDVDGFMYFLRPAAALGFRRGWTHGILAMALWPFVLAGVVYLFERRRFRDLLLISAVSIWSHPLLDLMNVYGVRLLMPFSQHWFYADTLFIVDPWIWIALIVGIVWSRRAESARPMRVILAGIGIYIAGMMALGLAGRGFVRGEIARTGGTAGRLMVAPVAANPLRREVVAEVRRPGRSLQYLQGMMTWRGAFSFVPLATVEPNDTSPAARRAAATPRGRMFLRWARFPYVTIGPDEDCAAGDVCLHDLRYPAPWAEVAVPMERTLSSQP